MFLQKYIKTNDFEEYVWNDFSMAVSALLQQCQYCKWEFFVRNVCWAIFLMVAAIIFLRSLLYTINKNFFLNYHFFISLWKVQLLCYICKRSVSLITGVSITIYICDCTIFSSQVNPFRLTFANVSSMKLFVFGVVQTSFSSLVGFAIGSQTPQYLAKHTSNDA